MKTQFPTETGFSGIYINGYRRNPSGDNAQLMGTAVVKRHYQINAGALLAIQDPDEIGIQLSDRQKDVLYDGKTNAISVYEHDLAIYKPLADIIVRDDYLVGHRYQLLVEPSTGGVQSWFSRTIDSPAPLPADADAQENVFGWQPRYQGVRFDQGSVPETFPNPAPVVPDMSAFDNRFFNGYRRDFAQAGFPQNQIQAGDSISMTRTLLGETQSDTLFEFSLGQESIRANLYLYSGKGPDKDRYWCVHTLSDVRLDTLVITPSISRVYAVWRAVWDYASYPSENYRKLDLISQGVSNG
ncbi:MAG: hypothetical protein ACI82S_000818 [Patiriisocius sp.]|jgi:hypothetical protein